MEEISESVRPEPFARPDQFGREKDRGRYTVSAQERIRVEVVVQPPVVEGDGAVSHRGIPRALVPHFEELVEGEELEVGHEEPEVTLESLGGDVHSRLDERCREFAAGDDTVVHRDQDLACEVGTEARRCAVDPSRD